MVSMATHNASSDDAEEQSGDIKIEMDVAEEPPQYRSCHNHGERSRCHLQNKKCFPGIYTARQKLGIIEYWGVGSVKVLPFHYFLLFFYSVFWKSYFKHWRMLP